MLPTWSLQQRSSVQLRIRDDGVTRTMCIGDGDEELVELELELCQVRVQRVSDRESNRVDAQHQSGGVQ